MLRETPAADGVWMLINGTPLGATSTVGRWAPGTLNAPVICALAGPAPSKPASAAPTTMGLNATAPAAATVVALEAPLPVLFAVS
ncbi:hypothetical protein D3C87_1976200 [compost metagenome]